MTTDSPAAWALWFLMLGLYSIVLFIGTVTSVYVTYLYVSLLFAWIDRPVNIYSQPPDSEEESPLSHFDSLKTARIPWCMSTMMNTG